MNSLSYSNYPKPSDANRTKRRKKYFSFFCLFQINFCTFQARRRFLALHRFNYTFTGQCQGSIAHLYPQKPSSWHSKGMSLSSLLCIYLILGYERQTAHKKIKRRIWYVLWDKTDIFGRDRMRSLNTTMIHVSFCGHLIQAINIERRNIFSEFEMLRTHTQNFSLLLSTFLTHLQFTLVSN